MVVQLQRKHICQYNVPELTINIIILIYDAVNKLHFKLSDRSNHKR